MSTRAVTPDAPAVSERNSNFLPSDENYRLTGAMPDASSERDVRDTRDENRQEDATGQRNKSAVTEEAPAASETEEQDSSTAAASEAANAQEKAKGPAQTKTPNSSENRWQKREREIRELREENARLKASQTSAPPRSETQQEPRPATEAKAANAEPQIEDVDAGGKPKYATLKDFMAAHAKWNREEAIREVTIGWELLTLTVLGPSTTIGGFPPRIREKSLSRNFTRNWRGRQRILLIHSLKC